MGDLVKRLRDWQHVYPEDEDKPEGHLYEVAADRIAALEVEMGRLRAALAEAVYLLDPEAEDILKGAGIYRIVRAYSQAGGFLPDDLKDALQIQHLAQREGEE